MGRARSGKDSVAAHLTSRFAYARVAFADPLKEMALRINPEIVYDRSPELGTESVRLSTLVEHVGWERAKDDYPEVRRLLQHMGQTVREYDEDFWLNIAAKKISGAAGWGIPVVVTDVRYPNEAEALKRAGFKMVRVLRPVPVPTFPQVVIRPHVSETALDDFPADVEIRNVGTLEDLRGKAESLARA
ncbi:deoxynucleotide monophosphate kinase family protein [Streptomyces avermitilis]|uniref:deoxynucleotide monophosphate kinase family protein n=1 Tax=Streptomyces avermitilis TaxID=33903 RepID=UPI0038152BC4